MSGYRFDRLKILVVDDNQHVRKLISTILQAFGTTQIFEATNGDQALTLLNKASLDVIFLDFQMNDMTGLELVKAIRTSRDDFNPFVPIIMLSAHTHIDHVRKAHDAGANQFLAKPVSVRAIMSCLVAAIEHPHSFVRTKGYFGPCRRLRTTYEYHGPEQRTVEVTEHFHQLAAE